MQHITWTKSTHSFSNSNCVQAALLPDGQIGVRDSKHPEGPVLRFTPGEWDAFTAGVRDGEFGTLAGHDNPA
jgi:Domain of unknown function (DUF397)